jgi:hypothetical protein
MFDVSESDFIRQMVPTAEDLPPGVTPQMVAKPTPAFDINQFAPELTELAFDRPEFEAFIEAEARKPEFQRSWEEAAKARPRRDRAAEIRLQEERLAGFQRAAEVGESGSEFIRALRESGLDTQQQLARAQEELEAAKDFIPSAIQERREDVLRLENQLRTEAALERAQAQFKFETGAVFPVYEKYTDPVTGQERSKLTGEVSPTAMKAPGFFQSEQNLADIRKMMVQPGQTQEEFFEKQLPGFERRFEASPFFKQQEERTKREEEEKRAADKKVETERRTLLASGRGVGAGTARTIFRRGRR